MDMTAPHVGYKFVLSSSRIFSTLCMHATLDSCIGMFKSIQRCLHFFDRIYGVCASSCVFRMFWWSDQEADSACDHDGHSFSEWSESSLVASKLQPIWLPLQQITDAVVMTNNDPAAVSLILIMWPYIHIQVQSRTYMFNTYIQCNHNATA